MGNTNWLFFCVSFFGGGKVPLVVGQTQKDWKVRKLRDHDVNPQIINQILFLKLTSIDQYPHNSMNRLLVCLLLAWIFESLSINET